MQLPLELLRCVLDAAAAHYTCGEFLQLRLTSCLFDEEVRSIFFTDHGLESFRFYFLCGAVSGRDRIRQPFWNTVPASLGHAYLYHRVKWHGAENSLFAYLFVPVFESQLKKLGISERDYVTRHEKLRWWASFCMHKYWKQSWVVVHASRPATARTLPLYDNYMPDDEPEKRIENDRKFLEICCAIVADDKEAVLNAFEDFHSGVDDLNYCFGTTVLGFAVKNANPDMLQLLVRSVRQTSRKHLYKYLSIALSEACQPEIIANILLSNLTKRLDYVAGRPYIQEDTARTIMTRDLLVKAMVTDDVSMIKAICRWIASFVVFPGKQVIIETCFRLTHDSNKKKPLHNMPYSPNLRTTTQSVLSIIPAHHFGTEYQHLLCKNFSVLEPWMRQDYRFPKRGWYWRYDRDAVRIYPRHFVTRNPLFRAVLVGWMEWVDWLLWAGADPGYKEEGMELLDVAWSVGRSREVAELIHRHGWRYRYWKWAKVEDGPRLVFT